MTSIDKDSESPSPGPPTENSNEKACRPHYFTVAELRLFSSDDPAHENDYDEFSDTYLHHSEDLPDETYDYSEADSLACLDDPLDDELGEICELHVYENRFDSRGMMRTVQVGAMDELPIETHRDPHAALVVVRTYDQSRTLKNTTLEIRSPYMRRALRKVIGTYPGVNLDSYGIIQISGPEAPRCLFHYRHELQAYSDERYDDEDIQEHMNFLSRYMAKAMHREMQNWLTLMESSERRPGLEYEDLWMAFRPGDLLYDYDTVFKAVCLTRLHTMDMSDNEDATKNRPKIWMMTVSRLDCDGDWVGYTTFTRTITRYDGYRALIDLQTYPLKYHENEARVREEHLQLGKRWLSLVTGVHHRSYTGVAVCHELENASRTETLSVSFDQDTT